MDEAGALLGHEYYLDGTVMRGDQRGRTLGFPTANLCTDNELLPPHGVYATTVRVGFVQRLRDERAFESLDLLRAQIDADCRRARVLFGRLSL